MRAVWLNKQWGSEWERKIWLMFQKQPSSGIPQAGRGDKHLLTLLCFLYVITFPHSRPDEAGSSVHSAQASPAWEPHEKGNHWLLLSGLFLLREILFEGSCLDYLVWEVFKCLPVAITDKNWQANSRLNTETISFFCNGTFYTMFRKRENTTIILISHWRNENRRHVLFGQAIREKLDAVQIGREPLSRCSRLSKNVPRMHLWVARV